MKQFNLSALLLCAFFTFSAFVTAQQPNEANPKALEMMSRGDFRGAIGVLDKDIAKNKNLFESYKLRASLKRSTGDFAGALNDYDKAIELKSTEGELYESRAMMRLIANQNPTLILSDFDAAIANGRKHEKVYTSRAIVRRQAGDNAGAIADYQTVIAIRPDYAQAYVGLASIYQVGGELDKAASILEEFTGSLESSGKKTAKIRGEVIAVESVDITVLPSDQPLSGQNTVIYKSESREMPGNQMPTKADLDKMSEKLERSKNTALAYINLSQIYEQQKKYEKALETVEKGIRIDPSDFFGYEMRGRIKLGLGDYEGAVVDTSKSIAMFPGRSFKYLDRGIAYLMLGKDADAQKDFDKFLQFFPNNKPMLDKRIEEAKERMPK